MIIWIASYPKSGNTWIRSFLTAYYFCDNGIFDINKLNIIQDYPNKQFFKDKVKDGEIHKHWDESQKAIVNEKKIKFLKTHNSLITAFGNDFTSPKYSLGVIYIIRDPRNVITSVKNHNDFETYEKALEFMQNENTVISDYKHLKNFAKTNIINSWRINYQSWLSNNRYRRMTIKYEDLIRNPNQTLRDLVIFVNTICKFNNGIDLKKLENAIQTTTFEKMQNLENTGEFTESVFSSKTNKKVNFFYLGPKNNWKNILDEKLQIKISNTFKGEFNELGYK